MRDDLAARSTDIHWPDGFSPPDADLFSHNEVLIDAPRSAVWQHLMAAEKWPQWYPNSMDVHILDDQGGELREGSRFEWCTFGMHMDSVVTEFEPESRIGWYGDGTGLHAYHTWLLTDQAGGCHVVMEEASNGPGSVALRKSDPQALHNGHDLWNNRLKLLSEGNFEPELSRRH
jgi:uncharacterized protein YndB with AHSA1/START domain